LYHERLGGGALAAVWPLLTIDSEARRVITIAESDKRSLLLCSDCKMDLAAIN
jgi:hypothetical protein